MSAARRREHSSPDRHFQTAPPPSFLILVQSNNHAIFSLLSRKLVPYSYKYFNVARTTKKKLEASSTRFRLPSPIIQRLVLIIAHVGRVLGKVS